MPAPLAATMGDPAGIGPDIIIATWLQREALQLPAFVVFADPEILRTRADVLGLHLTTHVLDGASLSIETAGNSLPVIDVGRAPSCAPGKPDAANAPVVIKAIEAAVQAVAQHQASAVVTAPIAKHVLYASGFTYPGHTEFLGELATRHWAASSISAPVMMLACDELLVVPLTVHVPLAEASALVTRQLIKDTAHTVLRALSREFGIPAPRLAIAGLNPHAGENATLGMQERDVIAPAIEALQTEGHDVSGPHSADTLFHAQARATYDAVITMYHDQALIPIKTLAFDRAVNTTLGLPFIRTSPDHGTAFDIAGTGRASVTSFAEALRLADRLATVRAESAT